MEEREALLWLYLCPGLDPKRKRALLASQGSAQAAQLWARSQGLCGPPVEVMDEARASAYVTLLDPEYPRHLRILEQPPLALFYRGRLAEWNSVERALTMVGTRFPTSSGRALAQRFARQFSERGIAVVSGLALGIDSASHRGSLDGTGLAAAVVGCGLNRCYPAENVGLFRRLEETGVIFSEHPPSAPPLPGNFPRRNRLLAALSQALLVLEAPARSGALNTVEHALSLGREVFVVPGSVEVASYQGSLRLIKEGAGVACSAQDVIEQMWPALAGPGLEPDLSGGPARPEEWSRRWGLSLSQTLRQLSHWELRGRMRCDAQGYFGWTEGLSGAGKSSGRTGNPSMA